MVNDFIQSKSDTVENGKEVVIRCSGCTKPLLTVFISRPNASLKNYITALCPFCGEKSFRLEIDGIAHLGACKGVDILDTDTVIEETEDSNNVIQRLLVKLGRAR